MNEPKKTYQVDVITKYFYPVAAGIETNIMETYSELVKQDWNVTVHTTRDTYTEKNILPDNEIIRKLKIKRYNRFIYFLFPGIDWKKTDLICLHNFNVFPHFFILVRCFILKLINRKKFGLILIPHGGFTPEWSIFSNIVGRIKKFYHFSLGTFLINNSVDAVRAVSLWERDQIINNGVNKELLFTIPNGVENEAYLDVDKLASKKIKNKVKSLSPYLIQIGRIYKIKNLETTIKALSLLNREIKLAIAGPIEWKNSGYMEEIKSLIKRLKLQHRVVFLGVIRGVDKYYLIKHAELLVHMAIWESFCNVVHEGLSQGLVCIVANNTALPYLVKDQVNGYCLDTFDYKGVAERIKFVISEKQSPQIVAMKERNRTYGLETSWKKVAEKMDRLYTDVVKSHKIYDKSNQETNYLIIH